jgi:hypothetical protein
VGIRRCASASGVIKGRMLVIILTLTLTLSRSRSHCHTHTVKLTLSHSHCQAHTVTLTLPRSRSRSHCHAHAHDLFIHPIKEPLPDSTAVLTLSPPDRPVVVNLPTSMFVRNKTMNSMNVGKEIIVGMSLSSAKFIFCMEKKNRVCRAPNPEGL